jgi:hypothetical protein
MTMNTIIILACIFIATPLIALVFADSKTFGKRTKLHTPPPIPPIQGCANCPYLLRTGKPTAQGDELVQCTHPNLDHPIVFSRGDLLRFTTSFPAICPLRALQN